MGVVRLAWDLFTAKVGNRSEARGRIMDFDPILSVLRIAKQHRMRPPFIIEARNWDDFGGSKRRALRVQLRENLFSFRPNAPQTH